MTSFAKGAKAPAFTLPGLDGKPYSSTDALRKGPVVLAFFKVSCPVCQFTFPFLERLFQAYGSDRTTFWAISQDDARDTREFLEEYGVSFPTLVDEDGYPASNLYGLTNVPTLFLVRSDGTVAVSCIGFSRADLIQIGAELAEHLRKPVHPVFRPDEEVPDYKPG